MPSPFKTLPPKYNGKHPGGRPTKKTPELVKVLSEALAMGMPDQEACDLVMIKRETLDQWRSEDDQFSDMLKSARAAKMRSRIERIDAGPQTWTSTAWMLERTSPAHFAKPETQVTMNITHSGEINHQVHMIPESQLLKLTNIVHDIEAEVEVETVQQKQERLTTDQ